MHEPFNVRPKDSRYVLSTSNAYGWQTGTTLSGLQILLCGNNTLTFDPYGHLLTTTKDKLAIKEAPISVRRFWLPKIHIGIEDLDSELALFYTAPDEFVLDEEDIEAWIQSGQFVFHCGWNEYVIGREGQVETS